VLDLVPSFILVLEHGDCVNMIAARTRF